MFSIANHITEFSSDNHITYFVSACSFSALSVNFNGEAMPSTLLDNLVQLAVNNF
jgi:hypothetical protein